MTLKGPDVDKAWRKLGFDSKTSGDIHAILRYEGKMVLRTKRSMGSGKLDGNIPHFIRQQMKLDEAQFDRAIDCPMTRDEYIQILIGKGVIVPAKRADST